MMQSLYPGRQRSISHVLPVEDIRTGRVYQIGHSLLTDTRPHQLRPLNVCTRIFRDSSTTLVSYKSVRNAWHRVLILLLLLLLASLMWWLLSRTEVINVASGIASAVVVQGSHKVDSQARSSKTLMDAHSHGVYHVLNEPITTTFHDHNDISRSCPSFNRLPPNPLPWPCKADAIVRERKRYPHDRNSRRYCRPGLHGVSIDIAGTTPAIFIHGGWRRGAAGRAPNDRYGESCS